MKQMGEPGSRMKREMKEREEDQAMVHESHMQMRTCPKCKSQNTRCVGQGLTENLTDVVIYLCADCGNKYQQEFKTIFSR